MDFLTAVVGGVVEREEQAANFIKLAPVEVGSGEIAASKMPGRSKRDEWREECVLSLLEAYESKWLLTNQAEIKGSDWKDIARQVFDRNCGTKGLRILNKCKNKIESIKKRYGEESASGSNPFSGSSWLFYAQMDSLLKGCNSSPDNGRAAHCVNEAVELLPEALPKADMEDLEHGLRRVSETTPPQEAGNAQIDSNIYKEVAGHMQDSNEDDGSRTLLENGREIRALNSEISTPRSKIPNVGGGFSEIQSSKRRKCSRSNVAKSIRMLAHSILKLEQAWMELYLGTQHLRAEAEIRQSEMELKRTEIIANTQLEITKILAG